MKASHMNASSTHNFGQTQWTQLIHPAQDRSNKDYIRLSNQLCEDYQPLVYGYIRKTGRSHEDAQDLTQEFFIRAFGENDLIGKADKAKGRFRTFVIACVKNLLRDTHKSETRQKRDFRNLIHFDSLSVVERLTAESGNSLTPDQYFEYTLALEVFRRIEAEFEIHLHNDGKLELFKCLRPWVYNRKEAPSYAELSAQLGISSNTLVSSTHRMKKLFRVIRDQHFERIVANPDDIPNEIRAFQIALERARNAF